MNRPMYLNKTFLTTHNSYSIKADMEAEARTKGSLRQQLDSGVRGLELDVQLTDPFEIGHDRPGDEVFYGGGNPCDSKLTSWLQVIKDWSDLNPSHDPVSIVFDLKGDWGQDACDSLEEVFATMFSGKVLTPAANPQSYADYRRTIIGMSSNDKVIENETEFKVFFYIRSVGLLDMSPVLPATAGILLANFNARAKETTTEEVRNAIVKYQQAGIATRVYHFDDGFDLDDDPKGIPPPPEITFPATDHPYEHKYQHYNGYSPGAPSWNTGLAPKFPFRTVRWYGGTGENYGPGFEPSVAINEQGVLVEVHREEARDLYYKVGRLRLVDSPTPLGLPPTPALDAFGGNVQYDAGLQPTVAISGDNICEVHKSQSVDTNGYAQIWCNVGKLTNTSIAWNERAQRLGVCGKDPAVSMGTMKDAASGLTVIIVVLTLENSDGVNCCAVGKLDAVNKKVAWGELVPTDIQEVSAPDIGINNDGLVAMAWSDSKGNSLYNRIGILKDQKLEWKSQGGERTYPLFYDTGAYPSIALLPQGDLIEIHKAGIASDALWSKSGIRHGTRTTVNVWNISEKVNAGDVARIAANKGFVAEVHKSQNADELWYSLGTYSERSNP